MKKYIKGNLLHVAGMKKLVSLSKKWLPRGVGSRSIHNDQWGVAW